MNGKSKVGMKFFCRVYIDTRAHDNIVRRMTLAPIVPLRSRTRRARRNYEMAIKFIRLSGSLIVALSLILQS